jgi:hypothetical protein
MRHVFELGFISLFVNQNSDEKMFLEEQEMVIGFWFKLLVVGVVRELFRVERQSLCWEHTKQFDECDIV